MDLDLLEIQIKLQMENKKDVFSVAHYGSSFGSKAVVELVVQNNNSGLIPSEVIYDLPTDIHREHIKFVESDLKGQEINIMGRPVDGLATHGIMRSAGMIVTNMGGVFLEQAYNPNGLGNYYPVGRWAWSKT